MIIDVHTHAFPDHIAERAVPFLEQEGQIEAYLDGTLSSLLASMDAAGVDASVVASIATKPSQFESILSWSKTIASHRILPFPSVHPEDDAAANRVSRIARAGFWGLKMHPYYQGFALTDARVQPIFEAVQDAGLVLLMHAGFDLAFPRDRLADPTKVREIMRRYPMLKLIASHLGAWEDWDEVETHLLGREIYLDTSYALPFLPTERAKAILSRHPEEYLLFGTDSPWGGQAAEIETIRSLDLPPERTRKILGENAARLLGIDTAERYVAAGPCS
jgi:hypothetical protein